MICSQGRPSGAPGAVRPSPLPADDEGKGYTAGGRLPPSPPLVPRPGVPVRLLSAETARPLASPKTLPMGLQPHSTVSLLMGASA